MLHSNFEMNINFRNSFVVLIIYFFLLSLHNHKIVISAHVDLFQSDFYDIIDKLLVNNQQWINHSDITTMKYMNAKNNECLVNLFHVLSTVPNGLNQVRNIFNIDLDKDNYPYSDIMAHKLTNSSCLSTLYEAESLLSNNDMCSSSVLSYGILLKYATETVYSYDKSVDYCIFRSLLILSENMKEYGYTQYTSKYRSFMDQYYSLASNREEDERIMAINGYLNRLRGLLTSVSPLPINDADALVHRDTIVYPGLRQLLEDIQYSMHIYEFNIENTATTFQLAHQGINERQIQALVHKIYKKLCPSLEYYPHVQLMQQPIEMNHQEKHVVRMAFVSSLFYSQSIGRLLFDTISELIRCSNRLSDCVDINFDVNALLFKGVGSPRIDNSSIHLEIYVFFIDHSVRIDPLTNTISSMRDDAITKGLEALLNADEYRRFIRIFDGNGNGDVSPGIIPQIRQLITSYHIDILIYPEIGMDLVTYLLSFSRLALIQAVWWGHPITTGDESGTIDFYLGLELEIEGAGDRERGHYTEQLVRMDIMSTAPLRKVTLQQNTFFFHVVFLCSITSVYR